MSVANCMVLHQEISWIRIIIGGVGDQQKYYLQFQFLCIKAISFYLFLLCSVARCKVGILEDDGDESLALELNKSGEEELRLLGFLCPEEFSCEGYVGAVALASHNVCIRAYSPSEQSAGCLFVFATKLFLFVCLLYSILQSIILLKQPTSWWFVSAGTNCSVAHRLFFF